jgi:hypothetical protein
LKGYFVRIKWWLLFERGVNTRRDVQLEKIVSEYDAKGGGRERLNGRIFCQNVNLALDLIVLQLLYIIGLYERMVLAPTWTRPLYDLVDKCLSRPEKGI